MLAKTAIPELRVSALSQYMEFVAPSVEDRTRLVVIVAKTYATVTCPVLYARSPAKSAAIILNAANYAMNLVHHVRRTVLGLVHIVDGVPYHVQSLVTCYHVRNAVRDCWLADIDVPPFVGKTVQVSHIVRFVHLQRLREWSLTLYCHPLSKRSILMRVLASYHPVDTSLPWKAWMDT